MIDGKEEHIKVEGHIVFSIAAGGILYYFFRSLSASFACILSGIFLDVDHWLDYWLHEGINFNVSGLFRWSNSRRWQHLILILHSYEFLFLTWFLILVLHLGLFWFGIAVGFSIHMLLDLFVNTKSVKVQMYFLTYRILKRFNGEHFRRQTTI